MTLEAARSLANTYLDQARQGINPVHALERAATSRGLTIRALSESFLEDYVKMKELRALAKYSGTIRVHIAPRLGEVNAELLTREQVRATVKQVMVPPSGRNYGRVVSDLWRCRSRSRGTDKAVGNTD